ncbi:hypothetical protein [Chryseobacterium koreense]
MGKATGGLVQQAFGKKAGSVLKSSFVLRIKFSASSQFIGSKSGSSPSAGTFCLILKTTIPNDDNYDKKTSI